MTTHHPCVTELSDSDLLARLGAIVKEERELTVALLQHLAEVERRGLHLAKGCSSLFAYCVERLGFSEDVAYKRVGAARYCRRFPLALDLVAEGALHLSAMMLIGPHLTDANHRDWLMAAAGKTKREVEKLVASRCPKPDVASTIRKLPCRQASRNSAADAYLATDANLATDAATNADAVVNRELAPNPAAAHSNQAQAGSSGRGVAAADVIQPGRGSVSAIQPGSGSASAIQPSGAGGAVERTIASSERASERPRLEPLSASSYRIVFTASETLKQKLERARELCSHHVAPEDLSAVIEHALELLIAHEEKRRFAVQSPKLGSTEKEPDPVAANVRSKRAPKRKATRTVQQEEPDPVAANVQSKGASKRESSCTLRQEEPDPGAPTVPCKGPSRCKPSRCKPSTGKPPTGKPPTGAMKPGSEIPRRVPAAVRRAVWRRDAGQCSFVDDEGHRCNERRFLEIDHVVAFARGGPSTLANCRLLCRMHNLHEAKRTFGIAFMDSVRTRPRTR